MQSLLKYFGVCIILLISTLAAAQNNTDDKHTTVKLFVPGVCNMCKSRIETTSYDVSGVKSAKWNLATDTLTAVVVANKVTPQKIADALAKAGYRSDLAAADPKAYQKLPACCRYDDEGVEKHD